MTHAEHHPHEDDEVIDLEEYFAHKKPIPHGKRYRFRVDKQHVTVHVHELTGREILGKVGKTPEKFILKEKVHGSVQDIGPDQVVDLSSHHIERFVTIPREVQEGDAVPLRREFPVLADDVEFLESLGLRWEAITGPIKAIVIYQWPIPPGYNVEIADVHVRLSAGYPDTHIDMAYFSPFLARRDGRNINGLTPSPFDGRQWQQWSRHRTGTSQWRAGEDNLSTHMALVRDWLEAEIRKV